MYFSPSSPGANVTEEQKPSEDVINNVEPSLDLHLLNSIQAMVVWVLPCDIRERSKVQVTDNAQRLLLLGIVQMDSFQPC